MKRKIYSTIIIILFSISLLNLGYLGVYATEDNYEIEKVSVIINNYDTKNTKLNTSIELSYNESELIKNRFLEIEKNFQGIDKINKQIQILKELNILPSNFTINNLISTVTNNTFNSSENCIEYSKLKTNYPVIVSHLTIGGRIKCLFYIKSPFYNSANIMLKFLSNRSYISRTIGFLPVYIGATFKPVFVTVIGSKILKNFKNFLFPFFEILISCAGFSIAFYYIRKYLPPKPLFEFNLDVCQMVYIAGF